MISHSGAYSRFVRSRAVPRFRQEQIPQSRRASLRLQLFDDRHGTPAVLGDLLVIKMLIGSDMLIHERADSCPQVLHFGRIIEAHWFEPYYRDD